MNFTYKEDLFMLVRNKKERNVRNWICLVLVMCMLLGQFPVGVTALESQEFNITGIKAFNFRGSDWYIILNTDNASFSLNNVVSLTTTGVTVDGTATTGWFQKTTGTLEFDLDTDKAEHKVVIPAGTKLGEYTLKNEFVFYTHADGMSAPYTKLPGIRPVRRQKRFSAACMRL